MVLTHAVARADALSDCEIGGDKVRAALTDDNGDTDAAADGDSLCVVHPHAEFDAHAENRGVDVGVNAAVRMLERLQDDAGDAVTNIVALPVVALLATTLAVSDTDRVCVLAALFECASDALELPKLDGVGGADIVAPADARSEAVMGDDDGELRGVCSDVALAVTHEEGERVETTEIACAPSPLSEGVDVADALVQLEGGADGLAHKVWERVMHEELLAGTLKVGATHAVVDALIDVACGAVANALYVTARDTVDRSDAFRVAENVRVDSEDIDADASGGTYALVDARGVVALVRDALRALEGVNDAKGDTEDVSVTALVGDAPTVPVGNA